MRRRPIRLPYLGVLWVAVGVLSGAATQKPTKDVITHIDYLAGPTDLATAVQQAAAVVRVRVLSSSTPGRLTSSFSTTYVHVGWRPPPPSAMIPDLNTMEHQVVGPKHHGLDA